jgi:aromatic ring-opening dioxygenase catalytic subunit (LigB family)
VTDHLPTYFISHGGGPWPWLADMRRQLASLETSLARMPKEIAQVPKAVLVISGHWETRDFSVMTSANPPMVYDYSGFPPETYQIVYPAPGAPQIAQQAADLIRAAGLPVQLNDTQGFDHGTFAPLAIMYPEANVPVFQISLRASYDPGEHIALGRALAPLRAEGVLIVGSGLSYHNLRRFGPKAKTPSEAFDTWLTDVLALPQEARTAAIVDWEKAPYARDCHANEDHLVPLFVALGAAEEDTATRVYHQTDIFGGVTASSYRFG